MLGLFQGALQYSGPGDYRGPIWRRLAKRPVVYQHLLGQGAERVQRCLLCVYTYINIYIYIYVYTHRIEKRCTCACQQTFTQIGSWWQSHIQPYAYNNTYMLFCCVLPGWLCMYVYACRSKTTATINIWCWGGSPCTYVSTAQEEEGCNMLPTQAFTIYQTLTTTYIELLSLRVLPSGWLFRVWSWMFWLLFGFEDLQNASEDWTSEWTMFWDHMHHINVDRWAMFR